MKIIEIKKNSNFYEKSIASNNNYVNKNKHFTPSYIEWSNSIYNYNINSIKSLPILDNIVSKYINMYFNMYYNNTNKKFRIMKYKTNTLVNSKVWTSKPQFKHTNNEVVINVHTYDITNNIILKKLNKDFMKVKNKKYKNILRNKKILKNLNYLYKKYIGNLSISYNYKFYNSVKLLINNIKIKIFKKLLWRESRIFYYKKYLWINNLKYKNNFLKILHKLLNKIYNKKVTLNIINLKYKYLNADIFTEIICNENMNRKRSIKSIFNKELSGITTSMFTRNTLKKHINIKYYQNYMLRNIENENVNDNLNFIINSNYKYIDNNLYNSALDNIKNKLVTGARLEAAGRLTKRFTAQRAVRYIKYKGTIKNVDSSFRGLSTHIVRNNLSSNIQFSKVSSKNRIGSFGIKGWISSM